MFTGSGAAAPEPFITLNSLRDFSACHDIDCAIEESLPTVLVLMGPKANWKRDIVRWKTEMLERAGEVILMFSFKGTLRIFRFSSICLRRNKQTNKKNPSLILLLSPDFMWEDGVLDSGPL